MRVCPKCGGFSDDGSLAFCFVDGAPMIDVDPNSEIWNQGTRFIEKKQKASRRQRRKLKWRRVTVTATTVLVVPKSMPSLTQFVYHGMVTSRGQTSAGARSPLRVVPTP